MNTIFKITAFLHLALLSCSAASLHAAGALSGLRASAPEAAATPPAARSAAAREWTVMFYFVGKSDLEGTFFQTINSLEAVARGEDVAMVAEWGRMSGQPNDSVVDGDWTGSRVYLITPDDNTRRINSEVIAEHKRTDMGDWRHLAAFVRQAKERYPARRYMLFISGHGSGWYYEKGAAASRRDKGVAFDDETGNFIDTPALARVFGSAGPVDILVNDSCLQQGVEVAYELRNSARILIGAENFSYDHDYASLAAGLQREPGVDSRELAGRIVRNYGRYYGGAVDSYDLGALDLRGMGSLPKLLDAWTAAVEADGDAGAVAAAKEKVLRFDSKHYADLLDLVASYSAAAGDGSRAARAGAALTGFVEEKLLIDFVKGGAALRRARGLSVQLPGPADPAANFSREYSRLAINADSSWARFMALVDSAR